MGKILNTPIIDTGGLCDYKFEVGARYLVFTRKNKKGNYHMGHCSLTRRLWDTEYIKALDQLEKASD